MSGAGAFALDRPIGENAFRPCDLETLFAECRKRAERAHQSIEQDVDGSTFLGDVEPYPVAAQSLVGANFANGIFDRISKIFEWFANNLAHFPCTPPLQFLKDAFARIAAAIQPFGGDLRATCKGNLTFPCFYRGIQPQRSIGRNS